jgi:hypothetical protein
MAFSSMKIACMVTMQAVISVAAIQNVSAKEATKDLLAAQIRDQGNLCNRPLSANRDLRRSKRDEAVWVLRCTNATYRLRLVPDMAAHVEVLKLHSSANSPK